MNQQTYWQRIFERRPTRRRFLARAGAGAAAAAALAGLGCSAGRSKSPGTGAENTAHLLSYPEESTSLAQPGGVFKSVSHIDAGTFDVLAAGSTVVSNLIAAYTYPRLLKFATAKYPAVATGDVEGDLAESYELSPDRLQVTLKLRQGLRWETKSPTNGRPIDAQDVVFSWNKFARVSPVRFDLAYQPDLAPAAPVDSIVASDPRTVVVKLKQPDASVLADLASDRLLYVMPRESDGGFDPRSEVRGYGPWLMAENRPNFRVWTKNPDYYVKGRPLFDTIEMPIISDYMARLAQFKAGNIWNSVVSQDDVLTTKRQLPATILRQADSHSTFGGSLGFGYDGDSPWKDERLRQAVSCLIDRETLINLNTNRGRFSSEGLPVDVRYHTVVAAGWPGFWQDPKSSDFGPNGRYLSYDPAEARKLLAAAGYTEGIDTYIHFSGGSQYGVLYTRTAELISGMLSENGVHAALDPHDYLTDWLPNFQNGYASTQNVGRPIKGFSGIICRMGSSYPTAAAQLTSTLHKDGQHFEGMTADGKNPQAGDPDINQMLLAIRREFDSRRQQDLVRDFARSMTKKAYSIPNQPSSVLGFSVTWPVIGNFGVFRGWPAGNAVTEGQLNLWIDAAKAPLNRTSTS